MKQMRKILKKKLHPLLSYAVLFGVGAIAVSSAGTTVGERTGKTVEAPEVQANAATQKTVNPATLGELKAAAMEFSAQLTIIKSQVAELQKYGRVPPPRLLDAIGEGDQLASIIAQAQTMDDIGEADPGAKLRAIGATIAANAKF